MSRANSLERQMLKLINEERAEVGAGPLRLEKRLNDSAEDHSSWMLDVNRFSHTGEGGSSAGDRMRDADFKFTGNWTWGENIAWQSERGASGASDDVKDLHEGLMNSPGHRANILNPDFKVIGIGIEQGDYNGWDAVMVTQNFARTSAPLKIDGNVKPSENSAPKLEISDITLGKVSGERFTRLEKHLKVKDADGDAPVWFELLDTKGRDNFRFRGEDDRIDASTPFRVAADDIDTIRIESNKYAKDTTLKVRAFDGEDVGPWETFTLNTLSAEDWFAMA